MRAVHEADALAWLDQHALPQRCGVLTSLPNVDEFAHRDLDRWRAWFVDAAERTIARTPAGAACVFFQTDIRHGGTWIDKSFLLQLAAQRVDGAALLWHKLALRAPLGTTTNERPGYAHLLCFARNLTLADDSACPDVLPALGRMTWARAIGVDVATWAVRWLRDHARAATIVDPFCGVGTVLAIAEREGLDAIGVERNPGRAAKARALRLGGETGG